MSGIGQRIRTRRQELGLTQGQAADGICSPSLLSMAESGKAALSARTLARLAQRLGVGLREWLQEPEEGRGLQSRFALGLSLLESGEWQAAAEQFAMIERMDADGAGIGRIGRFEWLSAQARLAWQSGNGERAMDVLWEAYERAVVLRQERWQAESMRLMGECAEAMGRCESADEHYRRAACLLSRGAGAEPDARLRLYDALLRMAVKFGRSEEADAWAAQAQKWREQLGTEAQRAAHHRQEALVALGAGEERAALRSAEEAWREAGLVKRREERIGSMRAYAHHLTGQDRSSEARSWYERALAEAREAGDLTLTLSIAGELAACLLANGRPDDARSCWEGCWESALDARRLGRVVPAGDAFHQ